MRKENTKIKNIQSVWQIQEAKAKFSEVIENTSNVDFQVITKRGIPVAVIMSKKEFDRIRKPETSLLDFFRSSPLSDIDLDIKRSRDLPRDIEL